MNENGEMKISQFSFQSRDRNSYKTLKNIIAKMWMTNILWTSLNRIIWSSLRVERAFLLSWCSSSPPCNIASLIPQDLLNMLHCHQRDTQQSLAAPGRQNILETSQQGLDAFLPGPKIFRGCKSFR